MCFTLLNCCFNKATLAPDPMQGKLHCSRPPPSCPSFPLAVFLRRHPLLPTAQTQTLAHLVNPAIHAPGDRLHTGQAIRPIPYSVNPGTFRANIRNASPPSYAFPSRSHTVNYSRARVKFTIGNRSSTPSSSSGNTSILL